MESMEHIKRRKEVKRDYKELPFRVVINEILGKFYELAEKSESTRVTYFRWWLFEGAEHDPDKLKKEIKLRKLCHWTGREQKIVDCLSLSKEEIYEDTNKRIKLIYGYFSCDRFRKPFLVFRNYKFYGVGFRRKLYYPIDIKGMKSLHFHGCGSGLIGNREYKTLECLHIVKGGMHTERFNVIKNLKKLILDNYRYIKKINGWPNLEVLELIECDDICEIKDLKRLKRLKIKTYVNLYSSSYRRSLPTQLIIEDLPKIEKLEFIQTRKELFINISNEIIKSVKCLELVNCKHNFEVIGENWSNLEELILSNSEVVKQIKDLPKLKVLKKIGSTEIDKLENLKNLEVLHLDSYHVYNSDKSTMDKAIKQTKSDKTAWSWVKQLKCWNNKNLKFLQILKNVKHLELKDVSGLKKLENLNKLESLKLKNCDDIGEIKNLSELKKLKIIYYIKCCSKPYCEKPKTVNFSCLPNIKEINIRNSRTNWTFDFSNDIIKKNVVKFKCFETK